jgi:hypothetical protein
LQQIYSHLPPAQVLLTTIFRLAGLRPLLLGSFATCCFFGLSARQIFTLHQLHGPPRFLTSSCHLLMVYIADLLSDYISCSFPLSAVFKGTRNDLKVAIVSLLPTIVPSFDEEIAVYCVDLRNSEGAGSYSGATMADGNYITGKWSTPDVRSPRSCISQSWLTHLLHRSSASQLSHHF